MLKGYSHPRTPRGNSSLVPTPPWHFVGHVKAVTFTADPALVAPYLPKPLVLESGDCALFFIDWQYASDTGEEFLNPVESQYKETILLMSAKYQGESVAYCPFIWVNQDKSMARGMIQGWPKVMGDTHMTGKFSLASKAAPKGICGMTLSVKGRRMLEATIRGDSPYEGSISPEFSGATLVRYLPNLEKGKHHLPLVNQLVQLKSRDAAMGPIAYGEATLDFKVDDTHELNDFKPIRVNAGYQFEVALTVDDLKCLEDL